MSYTTIEHFIGNTPLVRLQRLGENNFGNVILAKLEGDNPAGSVKDRAAFFMISKAEVAGRITPGDSLIEATSGNTGIALAMAAAIKGYKMTLIMPENSSVERQRSMIAYGAKIVLTSKDGGMEKARDLALKMELEGKGLILNQFANVHNPQAHIETTGPEIWRDTNGDITHFVSSMGTTGTIVGCSQFLKSKNKNVEIIGVQPVEGAQIPGIRKWNQEYLPQIYQPEAVDRIIEVSQENAEKTTRTLAKQEGIFTGPSSGGAAYVALQLAQESRQATIVFIICDRGDRYLSTDLFEE